MGWLMIQLPLAGQSVSRVAFDYAITLLTDRGAELRFETEVSLLGVGTATKISIAPAAAADGASLLVGLLNREVEAASIDDDGTLRLALGGGAKVEVAPHAAFEAWTFAGPKGEKAVCMPGGELTTWGIV